MASRRTVPPVPTTPTRTHGVLEKQLSDAKKNLKWTGYATTGDTTKNEPNVTDLDQQPMHCNPESER